MASKKTHEQCLTWLRSMAADKNSLDGINAELCLNLINEQKERLNKLGVQFHNVEEERDRLRERINLMEGFGLEFSDF